MGKFRKGPSLIEWAVNFARPQQQIRLTLYTVRNKVTRDLHVKCVIELAQEHTNKLRIICRVWQRTTPSDHRHQRHHEIEIDYNLGTREGTVYYLEKDAKP